MAVASPIRIVALGSFAAAAVSVASIFLQSACTVLTNDALPDDAGPFDGSAVDAAPTACGTCVVQECSGTLAVCVGSEQCQKLRAQCGSSTGSARDACFCAGGEATDGGTTVDPLAAYTAFAACNDARTCGKCSASCSSSCATGAPQTSPACGSSDAGTDAAIADAGDAGDAAPAPAPPSVDACTACVTGSCDAANKLCVLGSECAVFLGCANACLGDSACVETCGKSHSTGKASAKELSNCTLTSCRSACGL